MNKEKIYCIPVKDGRGCTVGWELILNGHTVDSGPFLEPLKNKFVAVSPVEFIQVEERYMAEEMMKRDKAC